jgi:hypothetical protein
VAPQRAPGGSDCRPGVAPAVGRRELRRPPSPRAELDNARDLGVHVRTRLATRTRVSSTMYQIAMAVVAVVVSCWCAAEASEAVLGFSCDAQGGARCSVRPQHSAPTPLCVTSDFLDTCVRAHATTRQWPIPAMPAPMFPSCSRRWISLSTQRR